MVRGTAGRFRYHAGKTQHRQIQFINEGIDDTDRVIFLDVVVQAAGSKMSWLRSWPSTKRFIPIPPTPGKNIKSEVLTASVEPGRSIWVSQTAPSYP
jgi:hypothetical protein